MKVRLLNSDDADNEMEIVTLVISKIVLIDTAKEILEIERMKDGRFRLTCSKNLVGKNPVSLNTNLRSSSAPI